MPIVKHATAHLIGYKLQRSVGGSGVAAVDVITVELIDSDGATGLGFSYVLGGNGTGAGVLHAVRDQLSRFVAGQELNAPRALWQSVYRSFNRTGLGPNLLALAAIDVAYWDLTARRLKLPLGIAMGGQPRAVAVYGSGAFNAAQSPSEAASVALEHIARGLPGVKPRVAGKLQDAAVLAAVRAAVGDDSHVMADANEKCELAQAQWLMSVARDNGVFS